MTGVTGMNRATGRALDGIDHLRQSVETILVTPIGSRLMRRDFGSRNARLIDAPINEATLLSVYAASAEALAKWEPRLRLKRIVKAVNADPAQPTLTLDIEGDYDGAAVTLSGVRAA